MVSAACACGQLLPSANTSSSATSQYSSVLHSSCQFDGSKVTNNCVEAVHLIKTKHDTLGNLVSFIIPAITASNRCKDNDKSNVVTSKY